MSYLIIVIFIFTLIFALFENYLKQYRGYVYILIGLILILIAGLREVGIDPDSYDYESNFLHSENTESMNAVEYSYILISNFVHSFSNDVHILFLIYAFLGVSLKMYAFRKFSDLWFITLAIYISYYYVLHDCIQIRTGVLSGLLLMAIIKLGDGKKKTAFLLLALGCFFHYSAIILLPVFFLSNKEMSKKQRIVWGAIIGFSYIFSTISSSFAFNYAENIPYIGTKVATYKNLTDRGNAMAYINIFGPLQIITMLFYFYILYFYDTIKVYNKYLPVMIKMFSLGLFFYVAFSFLPAFGERVSYLYEIVRIVLYANVYYTIRPKWAAALALLCIGFFNMSLCLGYLGFKMF